MAAESNPPAASTPLARVTSADARRLVMLFTPSMTAPLASVMVANSVYGGQASSAGAPRRLSRGADARSAGAGAIRFVTTQTEEAMDSVLPSAPEEFFKRRFGRFSNPSHMRFSYH